VDGAERMKKLVNDLLAYSRIGTNKEEFTVTDLNEAMGYVIFVLDEDIKKNQAVITVKPLPVIMANKTLISQLFMNLVSNSLKYHGGKIPEIEVGLTEEHDKYIFYVKDNGIGIDPKFFDKIFIIFQRLHNRTEYSGTGIGLAICKKIVETHKGKIWLKSEPGIGSTFYFSIPKN
jgi:light-regulated signal transduction histidine kinase (bacteriophytochrome)